MSDDDDGDFLDLNIFSVFFLLFPSSNVSIQAALEFHVKLASESIFLRPCLVRGHGNNL